MLIILLMIIMTIAIIMIIVIIIIIPKTRKYWLDVQRGIVPSHGEKNLL